MTNDMYKRRVVKDLDTYTQGIIMRHDADKDFIATHNMELLMRGIDPHEVNPKTGRPLTHAQRVFNPYLCSSYAKRGDPLAKEFWRDYVYVRQSQTIRPNLNADIAISYNRLMQTLRERQRRYGR